MDQVDFEDAKRMLNEIGFHGMTFDEKLRAGDRMLADSVREGKYEIDAFRMKLITYATQLLETARTSLKPLYKKEVETSLKKIMGEIERLSDEKICQALFLEQSYMDASIHAISEAYGVGRGFRRRQKHTMKSLPISSIARIRTSLREIERKILLHTHTRPQLANSSSHEPVKEKTLKTIETLVRTTRETYSMSPKEKLGRIASRVETILGKEMIDIPKVKKEIESMSGQLDIFSLKYPELAGEIVPLREQIYAICTRVTECEVPKSEHTHEIAVPVVENDRNREVLPQNIDAIAYIDEILKHIKLNISNTIQKGNKRNPTCGDGSFAVKILHPFLSLLKGEILMKNHIDAETTSLSEIASLCKRLAKENYAPRLHFLEILKHNDEKGNLIDLLQEPFRKAIKNFSFGSTNRRGINPLQRVLEKLATLQN